eukprot:CAMPEP_0172480454 /NCGR_PEP_ID=MMETSP1066-20121228/5572_1 /TAXON_ID=671091 /ORGANISM="Coscinodiscus wailesii, Strain CCMP2513" /LENGTH=59 /DNA_ID=CAMNT_0013241747 /DNA_START=195 /DNA_END=374 /DNA_ORIENTATION=-
MAIQIRYDKGDTNTILQQKYDQYGEDTIYNDDGEYQYEGYTMRQRNNNMIQQHEDNTIG